MDWHFEPNPHAKGVAQFRGWLELNDASRQAVEDLRAELNSNYSGRVMVTSMDGHGKLFVFVEVEEDYAAQFKLTYS